MPRLLALLAALALVAAFALWRPPPSPALPAVANDASAPMPAWAILPPAGKVVASGAYPPRPPYGAAASITYAIDATAEEFAAAYGAQLATAGYTIRRIPTGASGMLVDGAELMLAAEERNGRTIYISSGIHGDEPAGPVALRRLIDEDRWPGDTELILCPCLNPTGLQAKTRENRHGIDLNRDYRDPKSEEVRAHMAWLNQLPRFDLSLVLHEDWEADGYYLYDRNYPQQRLAITILV